MRPQIRGRSVEVSVRDSFDDPRNTVDRIQRSHDNGTDRSGHLAKITRGDHLIGNLCRLVLDPWADHTIRFIHQEVPVLLGCRLAILSVVVSIHPALGRHHEVVVVVWAVYLIAARKNSLFPIFPGGLPESDGNIMAGYAYCPFKQLTAEFKQAFCIFCRGRQI